MSLRSTQSARNFKHVIKNISIKSIDEGYLNHKNKNQHAFSMTNIHEDTVDDYKPKKNHKMNTLTVFNKFDTI